MFESIVAFFTGISLLWYGVILFIVGALIYGEDRWGQALVTLGVIFAGYWFFVGINWADNWKNILYGFLGYLAAGFVWSFVKWISTLYKVKRLVRAAKTEAPTSNLSSLQRGVEGKMANNGLRWFMHDQFGDNDRYFPSMESWAVREKLISWIVFWPFSVFNYMFYTLLTDLANWFFGMFKGTYRVLAQTILKDA